MAGCSVATTLTFAPSTRNVRVGDVRRFITQRATSTPMSRDDRESLERRVAAVERALSAGDDQRAVDHADLEGRVADLEADVDRLTDHTDDLADRLDELGAGLQAVRGFLGGVDAVNESVERRADAAIAAVARLEAQVGDPDESPFDPASLTDERAAEPGDSPENGREVARKTTPDGDDASSESALRERLRSLR